MKKLLVLILCLMMALAATACGRDEKKPTETEPENAQVQSEQKEEAAEEAEQEETNKEETDKEETASENSGEAQKIDTETAEALAEMIDEFNNTDDPAVKEELREKLEEILAQAEAASIGVITE